jgi:hypothetical protein
MLRSLLHTTVVAVGLVLLPLSAVALAQDCATCQQGPTPNPNQTCSNCSSLHGCGHRTYGTPALPKCLNCLTWKHFCHLKSWFHKQPVFSAEAAGAQHIAPPPKYLPVPSRPVFEPQHGYQSVPTEPFGSNGLGASLARPGYPRR